MRVFDGVIGQIHEHLPKAPSIRPHRFGEIGEIDAGERQALRFGPCTHRLGQAVQQLLEVELALLQLERARLDLGRVENVFDEPQEVFAGSLDNVQGLPLVCRQPALAAQELRVTQVAVERGPELMAHIR